MIHIDKQIGETHWRDILKNRLERHIGDTYGQTDSRDTLEINIDKQIGETHWRYI